MYMYIINSLISIWKVLHVIYRRRESLINRIFVKDVTVTTIKQCYFKLRIRE